MLFGGRGLDLKCNRDTASAEDSSSLKQRAWISTDWHFADILQLSDNMNVCQ